MGVVVDLAGDFLPLFGDDDELLGLAVGVDEVVGHVGDDECAYPAVDDHGHACLEACGEVAIEGEKDAGGHYGHVGDHHGAPYADVADFVDQGGDDVGAARRAVVDEDCAYAHAAEDGAEHQAHRHVGDDGRVGGEVALEHADGEGRDGGAEDGAQHEGAPQYPVADGEHEDVAGINRHRHRNEAVGGEEHQGADARKAADDDVVRQDEHAEADGVQYQAYDDHHIVLGVHHQAVVDFRFSHLFCRV